MDQYRFWKFDRVQGWVQMALLTFLYLEWYRARQLARRDLPKKGKRWWERQRTHGLCQAIRQQTERAELQYLAQRIKTPGGIRRLQRELEHACPVEQRPAACDVRPSSVEMRNFKTCASGSWGGVTIKVDATDRPRTT